MKLDDLVAVSGMSGIYKLAANRNNGLIVEDLDTGKKKFAPARKHQFTPLASIGIYTLDDSTELKVIFRTMLEQMESNPPISPNESSAKLSEYFRKILPDFDEDKVHASVIKKVIKWFNFLNDRNLIDMEDEADESGTEENESTEDTPKKED